MERSENSSNAVYNSVSSSSFRKNILTQSIMAFFGGSDGRMSPFEVGNRPHSDPESSNSGTEVKELASKDLANEEQDLGVDSAPCAERSQDESDRGSTRRKTSKATLASNSSPPHEGVVAPYLGKSDPFAGGIEGGVEYKSMVWWQAGMVMIAETISLGILSLPAALSTLGIVPGLIILVALGILASYSGYVIGQFKIRYPHVHSMADAGEILFGRFGREILGLGQLLFFVFIMGSHLLTFSIMMNAITEHATCTIVFMVVGTILSFLFTLPRTLKHLSYYSIASFVSIIFAVGITMVGVSFTRPGFKFDSTGGAMHKDIRLFPAPGTDFYQAFLAFANVVFAYAGHVAFFSFISELKEPKDFPKALALLQFSDISMYLIAAIVIYYYAGSEVKSPALDSASPLIRKVAYGIAIATIVIAGVVNGHVAVKYIYVRLFRDSKEDIMHSRGIRARGYWVALNAALWAVAWVIAEGVPVFNDLLGLTSALFASWFTFGLAGMFWLKMNWDIRRKWDWKKWVLFAVNILLIILGAAICVIGLYASSKSINENATTQKPFSCADNSRE